jgi:cold shock CspA family protein/ribosome-associated translation inhibitor RaiA
MQTPIQVTFRSMPVSDSIEAACHAEALKLEHFAGEITRCRVVISKASQRHASGALFEVHIEITIPGKKIAVNHVPSQHANNEDVLLAVREAFDSARRQIEDAVRVRRGDVKVHETPAHGRVARFFPLERYGFVTTSDGRELYFHANSLRKVAFESLAVGDEVRFVEEEGANGPQATSVARVGSHHHLAP